MSILSNKLNRKLTNKNMNENENIAFFFFFCKIIQLAEGKPGLYVKLGDGTVHPPHCVAFEPSVR